MRNLNIYMCGVGGQGIGVLSEVMIQASLAAGFQVKGVDTHGLAQRGGIVVSHLRLGDKLFTPRISAGEADIVIGLERLEAHRALLKMSREGGAVVFYDTEFQPIHVRMGKAQYPSLAELEQAAKKRSVSIERVYLEDLPDPRMQNTAVLGRLAALDLLPGMTRKHIEDALRGVLKPGALDANLEVFNAAAAQPAVAGQSQTKTPQ
jgi:indolepyruvate ferredoxin oxidoreductase beta subunit